MRAIQLMVPHDVMRSLFRIICKLVRIAFHADIRYFRETHLPFHFVAELNVDRSACDMHLHLVPLIQHDLLKEIPLRKLFFYTVMGAFDHCNVKFITDDLNCYVHQRKLHYDVRQSEILTLCAPQNIHYRLMDACMTEFLENYRLIFDESSIHRFHTTYQKYCNALAVTEYTTFMLSLRNIALSAFLAYSNLTIRGFRKNFGIDLGQHLDHSQLQNIRDHVLRRD